MNERADCRKTETRPRLCMKKLFLVFDAFKPKRMWANVVAFIYLFCLFLFFSLFWTQKKSLNSMKKKNTSFIECERENARINLCEYVCLLKLIKYSVCYVCIQILSLTRSLSHILFWPNEYLFFLQSKVYKDLHLRMSIWWDLLGLKSDWARYSHISFRF